MAVISKSAGSGSFLGQVPVNAGKIISESVVLHKENRTSKNVDSLKPYPFPAKFPKKISFDEINARAQKFADSMEKNYDRIIKALLAYESYEVAVDETARTLDLLKNLKENEEYFARQIGSVVSFLPRNQPLYALSCFGIVPALMAAEVHVRPPLSMQHFFSDLLAAIGLNEFFPNIRISFEKREDFVAKHAALVEDPAGFTEPITSTVIFTGTMENADKVRQKFDKRVLFIANGAGHNPIVVSEKADCKKAVAGAMHVQLYNQGQDCASPNVILVHKKKHSAFLRELRKELKKLKIGTTFTKKNRIGPLNDRSDLQRIQKILLENADWLDRSTPGVIHTKHAIVEPTIIVRPLKDGGNFSEVYGPIFFIQQYDKDDDLSLYFENFRYERGAMYITIYGNSSYVDSLVGKQFSGGKILHDGSTIIRNTDLHAPGVERGTQPYGGYGRGASCLSLNGKVIAKPTCPQRDIYEQIVYPALQREKYGNSANPELLKYENRNDHFNVSDIASEEIKKKETSAPKHIASAVELLSRDVFARLNGSYLSYIINLRNEMNHEYVAQLNEKSIADIRKLRGVLQQDISDVRELEKILYEIPKITEMTDEKNKKIQKAFFKDIYNLLFGIDKGPRLSIFLMSLNKGHILNLLNI